MRKDENSVQALTELNFFNVFRLSRKKIYIFQLKLYEISFEVGQT